MTCEEFRMLAMDYVEGELDKSELTQFRSHFTSCAECSDILRAIEGHAALLTALPLPVAPRDLGSRIEQALSDNLLMKRTPSPSWRWIAAAAASLFILISLLELRPAPQVAGPQRTIRVIDVAAPETMGRLAPSYENPGGSFLDPLLADRR